MKVLSIISACLCFLSSCQIADWQKITHYNDEVTTTNDSVYVKGKRIGDAVNKGMFTGDYSSVQVKTAALDSFVKNQITFFSRKLDINGSDTLRVAELAYLQFEEQVIQTHFMRFAQLNKSSTEDEIKGQLAALQPVADQDKAFFDRISAIQESYARLNGFPFTRGKYQNMFE